MRQPWIEKLKKHHLKEFSEEIGRLNKEVSQLRSDYRVSGREEFLNRISFINAEINKLDSLVNQVIRENYKFN